MRRTTLLRNVISKRTFSSTSAVQGEPIELAFTRNDPPNNPQPSGPPILLMHGLFGSQRNNRTMTRDLTRPVYTIDLRNHGESPHNAVHTYTAMAEDVEFFIAKHSIQSPTLIGHSMGAKVAMALALRQPQNYSALIPVDNAPVDAALKSDFGTYVNAMREIEEARPKITKQSDADKILAKYENDLGIRQFLLTNFVKAPTREGGSGGKGTEMRFRIPLQTLAKSLDQMADFPFKDPDRNQFKGPTLVVRGTKSHYVADESLPLIGRFFPKFELMDFDCGHWVMSEKFEGFKDGVVDWIGRVVDGKG